MAFRKWKYKNTALLIFSLILLFFVSNTEAAQGIIQTIGSYGYLGALVVGIFFVSTFTVAPAGLVLFHLAQNLDPVWLAISAGAGGAIGDLLIFHFLRDHVFAELRPFYKAHGGRHLNALLHSPYFAWFTPIIGAVLVASPFPDEIGVGLMGLSKIKTWQFALLVFTLDTLGILGIALAARSI